MSSPLNIKYLIIDDGILWRPEDVLTLPSKPSFSLDSYAEEGKNSTSKQEDAVYFCGNELPQKPVSTIAFSTYDGFALKNIFLGVLGIPSILISEKNEFPSIIQKRCGVLKIQDYVPNLTDKCTWICNFCKQRNCSPGELLYFGNDLNLTQNFSFATTVSPLLKPDPDKHILSFKPPHVIRQFANQFTEYLPEVQSYYSQTLHLKNDSFIGASFGNNSQNISQNDALDSSSTGFPLIKQQSPSFQKQSLRETRILVCDIDGTCTDGRMIVDENSCHWKRISLRDQQAILNWNLQNHQTFFITGEEGTIPSQLAQATETPSDHLFLKAGDQKAKILQGLCQCFHFNPQEMTYIGDDMNDLGVMKWLVSQDGQIACPSSAMPQIKAIPGVYVLQTPGGFGAVHELIQILNKNQ